jgi:pimeloyl-ACP methyl ester carboxylesterase
MEFEHVTFDLPHGTFHALQGGDPDGQPTIVLHGFPDHPPTAKPFLAELGRRGRHVVAPWLRGYAPSPTAGPFDFAALTSDGEREIPGGHPTRRSALAAAGPYPGAQVANGRKCSGVGIPDFRPQPQRVDA